MAFILSGNDVAFKLRKVLKASVESFKRDYGIIPRIAVVQLTENMADKRYREEIQEACNDVGIMYGEHVINYHDYLDLWTLESLITKLNQDKTVHGIMPLLPLPEDCKRATHEVINQIRWDKDVDCLTDMNLGELYTANDPDNIHLNPCIPYATMYLCSMYAVELESANCVIVGDPNDRITKPLTTMLLSKGATVTVCHQRTKNVQRHTEKADVLFLAANAEFHVIPEMIKSNAVVIDITGCNIQPEAIYDIASCFASPLNGVNPIATTLLTQNVLTLAKKHAQI